MGKPALFPMDVQKWKVDGWTFKRLLFVYQSALEVGCEISRGNPIDSLESFARLHHADGFSTQESPCPRHKIVLEQLRQKWEVEVLPPEPFLTGEADFDLRRFSRYWANARKLLPKKP